MHPKVPFCIFTPTYSSWLNQVELWFSKIDRDAIARGVFTSVSDLKRKLLRYIRHYNKSPLYSEMEICLSIAPSQYTISWYRPLVTGALPVDLCGICADRRCGRDGCGGAWELEEAGEGARASP